MTDLPDEKDTDGQCDLQAVEKMFHQHDLNSAESRYKVIAEIVGNINHSNIQRREIEISEVLKKGDVTFSEEQPSIFMKLIENADQYPQCLPYINILKALLPSYQKSSLPGKEKPLSFIMEKLESVQTWEPLPNAEDIPTIIQILVPVATEELSKYLCSLIIHWTLRGSALSSKFIDVLLCMIKNGADPAFRTQIEQNVKLFCFNLLTKGGMDEQGIKDFQRYEKDVPEKISASNMYARVISKQILQHPELKSRLLDLLDVMLTEEAVSCNNVDRIGQNILHATLNGIVDFDNLKVPDVEEKKSLLSRIIKKNLDLCNGCDVQGQTPLCHFIQSCLRRFAQKSTFSQNLGATFQEVFFFMAEVVSVLAPHTDVDLPREDGSTALHLLFSSLKEKDYNNIAKLGYCNELKDVVSQLLTKKNINMLNKDDVTPYSWVMLWQDSLELSESHQDMSDLLDNTACKEAKMTSQEDDVALNEDHVSTNQEDNVALNEDHVSTHRNDKVALWSIITSQGERKVYFHNICDNQNDTGDAQNIEKNNVDDIDVGASNDNMETVNQHCLDSDKAGNNSKEADHESFSSCHHGSNGTMESHKGRAQRRSIWASFQELHTLFWEKEPDTGSSSSGKRYQRGLLIADALTQVEWNEEYLTEKLKQVRKLSSKGYPECLKHPVLLERIRTFLIAHLFWLDRQLSCISRSILETLIGEINAQLVYDIVIKHSVINAAGIKKREGTNTEAFHLASLCLDYGASPKIEDIVQAQFLILQCETSEKLLASMKFIVSLVCAYRKNGNSDSIFCFLNPLQNQYIVNKAIREAAEELVLNSYSTIEECSKSRSLINVLLYTQAGGEKLQSRGKYFRLMKQLNEEDNSLPTETNLIIQEYAEFYKMRIGDCNASWLQRGVLHLAVTYCHDENVLNSIPTDIVEEELNKKDVHGSTPLHIAYLHNNEAAITFLKSHGAKEDELDLFGNSPQSLSCHAEALGEDMGKGQLPETEYIHRCSTVMTISSGVFEALKPLLLMPEPERKDIAEQMMQIFKMLVPDAKKVQCGGSVREKLKVGQFDEIDLQIFLADGSTFADPANSMLLHAHLVSGLAKVHWSGISLRPISVMHPWLFMWEGQGSCHLLVISVDVVPIKTGEGFSTKKELERQVADDRAEKPSQPEYSGMREEEEQDEEQGEREEEKEEVDHKVEGEEKHEIMEQEENYDGQHKENPQIENDGDKDCEEKGEPDKNQKEGEEADRQPEEQEDEEKHAREEHEQERHEKICFLKWKNVGEKDTFVSTDCEHEWDILDSLPIPARLGILFTKALLTALKNTKGIHNSLDLDKPITSYMIKITMLWILSGDLLNDRFLYFDEDMRSMIEDWKLKSKLVFKPDPHDWFTEEEINLHAKEGRLWAERVVLIIREMIKQGKLPMSFVNNKGSTTSTELELNASLLAQVIGKLLERLKPDMYFYGFSASENPPNKTQDSRLEKFI